MLTIFDVAGDRLAACTAGDAINDKSVWIDLLSPTPEEDRLVEAAIGISIPTRAEMREIETSSRLYVEQGAHFMTALLVHDIEAQRPIFSNITFILAGHRLITVRYAEPRGFPLYLASVDRGDAPCNNGAAILAGLIETLIQRMADLVERVQDEVERLAGSIFDIKGGAQTRHKRLDVMLKSIGKQGEIASRAQESAASLDRVLMFFVQAARDRKEDSRLIERIESVHRDVRAIAQHVRFLSDRTAFLLDATLGMINIEQNQIIKLFSVMAVMLMPPTLVASIYGMNFRHMPELEWSFGYPLALITMLVAAVVPFVYFRRKGWL